MADAAYYANITEDTTCRTRLVAWHFHCIVWGIARKDLQQRFSWLSGKRKNDGNGTKELPCKIFEGVRPGLRPLDVDAIKPGQLDDVLIYILKSPREQYSLFKNRKASERLGRTVFRQKPRDLRPGIRFKLFQIMNNDLFLDQMLDAGGTGVGVASRIKIRATAELKRRQRAEREPKMSRPGH
jgi:hypothetical protein